MRKFPRVVRLDGSDPQVYPRAAEPGEWAVTGSFAYADRQLDDLEGKARLAFHGGWLGCESFGRASLVEVAEITDSDFLRVVEGLARHLVEAYGAPGLAEALPAARQEAEDAASLCDHETHQLLSIERELGPEGLVERVRVVRPERARDHAKIWRIVEEDEESEPT